MIRKNYIIIVLFFIYILFLTKDNLIGIFNKEDIITNYCYNDSYYQKEYNALNKLVEIEIPQYKLVYSKIILRDIYNFYDTITINKGTNSGLKKGDLVINEKGVIGTITEVNTNSSIISLLTNKKSNISVKINNSFGILRFDGNNLIVDNLKIDEEINVGDKVYTSGLTNIPSDFYIGTIKKVNKDTLQLEYILEIDPYNDFNNLNYVAVVTQ